MLIPDTVSRHPLHNAILECFMELCEHPTDQQAGFAATLTRVLLDSLVLEKNLGNAPTLLSNPDVHIGRIDIEETEDRMTENRMTQDGEMTLRQLVSEFREASSLAEAASNTAIAHDGLVISGPIATLSEMMDMFASGHVRALAFLDPIYEDSLITVQVSPDAAILGAAGSNRSATATAARHHQTIARAA